MFCPTELMNRACSSSWITTCCLWYFSTGRSQFCFFSSDLERFTFCFQSDQITAIVKPLMQPSEKISSFKSQICKSLEIFWADQAQSKSPMCEKLSTGHQQQAAESWARSPYRVWQSFRPVEIVWRGREMSWMSALKEVTSLHVHKKLVCRGKFMVDRIGQNGPNCLQQGRLTLDCNKNFLTVGGIKHWSRWLGKVKTSLFIKPD